MKLFDWLFKKKPEPEPVKTQEQMIQEFIEAEQIETDEMFHLYQEEH